jgi:hypothetical protein
VCVIVYFLEKVFPVIQNYYFWFLSRFFSLTSHIIKSSCINYTSSISKIKEHSFPSHAIYLSQYFITFYHLGPPVSSFFPDPRGVVQWARPSYNPRGTCSRWADTPAAPGWAEPRSRQFLAHGSKENTFLYGGWW